MTILNKNLSALQKVSPQLYTRIKDLKISENIKILKAGNDSYTLKVTTQSGEKLIHSIYNPEKEAETFIASFQLKKNFIPLVLGLGFGYHLFEIFKQINKFSAIFVFELREDIFKAALTRQNFVPILSNPKVKIFVTSNQKIIMNYLYKLTFQKKIRGKMKLIVHQPSLSIYKQDASEFIDIIEKIQIKPKMQQVMKTNFLANITQTIESPGINTFFSAFKNKPVFLISAGPSLSRDIESLKKIKNRGILICVSTAFSLLIKNKIIPDFVAIGDPKAIMLTHFTDLLENSVPLIFLPTASKEVISQYKGPKIVALQTGYSLSDFVAERVDKGRVDVGESVSTLILDVAIKTGANPIVFVGQDLSFYNGYSHAKGIEKRLKITHKPRTIKSITGAEIPASSSFYWFLHWIEKKIAQFPRIKFINVSQFGARIKGTLPMELETVIKEYCTEELKSKVL